LGETLTTAQDDGGLVPTVTYDGNDGHPFSECESNEPFTAGEVDLIAVAVWPKHFVYASWIDQERMTFPEGSRSIVMACGKLPNLAHDGGKTRNAKGRVKSETIEWPMQTMGAVPCS